MPSVVPFVGEPLALDLVNTRVRPAADQEVDFLHDHDLLAVWLDAEGDRLAVTGPVDLDALRTLRGHVDDALDHLRAGSPPRAATLRALTAAMRAAPAHRALSRDGATVVSRPARTGDPTSVLLAQLADAATDLLVAPPLIRRCAGPVCEILFAAANPRRRWCSPALCGNRVRVARYYQRHRTGEPH